MQNSASSVTLFTTQTIHNVPFFRFVENVGLKKKIFDSTFENNSKERTQGNWKKSMCSVYLEKDMLVSFRYCYILL